MQIATAALQLVQSATEPGRIVPLDFQWPTEWKPKARELSDKRTERHDTPQYERPDDELAARSA